MLAEVEGVADFPADKFALLFAAKNDFSECVDTLKEVAFSGPTGKQLTLRAMSKFSQDEITSVANN